MQRLHTYINTIPGNPTQMHRIPGANGAGTDGHEASVEDTLPRAGDTVTLRALERAHVQAVLSRAESLQQAAGVLGIDSSTLYRKRRAWGLD